MEKKHPQLAKIVQLVPKPLAKPRALECILHALVLLEQEIANQIDQQDQDRNESVLDKSL